MASQDQRDKQRAYARAYYQKHRTLILHSKKRLRVLSDQVKATQNAWRANNRDKVRAIARSQRIKHRQSHLARAKKWRAKNKDRIYEYNAAYRKKNRKRIRELAEASARLRLSTNPDKCRLERAQKDRLYRRRHPDKMRAKQMKKRLRKRLREFESEFAQLAKQAGIISEGTL